MVFVNTHDFSTLVGAALTSRKWVKRHSMGWSPCFNLDCKRLDSILHTVRLDIRLIYWHLLSAVTSWFHFRRLRSMLCP